MDNLFDKKKKLLTKLNKYRDKIYNIEDDLYNLELEMSTFDNNKLLNNIELNDKQKEIINSESNNILVIAVPGSGKTHTVINRYINLVNEKNINSDNIILITFTKKSGNEMLDRINRYVPHKQPYYVGSLHGLAFKLLNKINYSILDEKDTYQLITDICYSLTDNEFLIKNINYIYDKLSSQYPQNLDNVLDEMDINPKFKNTINLILKKYNKEKKIQKLLDFNDLMSEFNKYLNTSESEDIKSKVKYLFFDEFQDINSIQYSIIQKFKKSNIMVVGDDAQSIYSFRGSNVNYILNYKYDKCYFLDTNYRSSPYIIDFFSGIIKNNKIKIKKDIKSNKTEKGIKPQLRYFINDNDQYEWIAEQIKDKYNNGKKLKDMAILARTNKSLNGIELFLKNKGIEYVKSSGLSILNKEPVKDFLAFISFIINNKNSICIKRILRLHNIKFDKNKVDQKLFNNDIKNVFNHISIEPKKTAVIIQKYIEQFYSNNMSDIKIISKYFRNSDDIIKTYNDLFLNIELDNNDDKLLLTTIHSSKGLEWDEVYFVDCDNKSLPNIRPSFYKNEINNYEEERRLFYVACSRAKSYLNLTYCNNISPFIKELNQDTFINNYKITEKEIKNNVTGLKLDLKINGYNKYMDKLLALEYKKILLSKKINIDIDINKYIDTFLIFVFKKILINNFSCKINLKLEENIKNNFIDKIISVNESLELIKKITDNIFKYKCENIKKLIDYNFNNFEKDIVLYFKNCKEITINNDNTIIIDNNFYFIQNSTKNICTVLNVLISNLLSKGLNISIFNPFLGINYIIN